MDYYLTLFKQAILKQAKVIGKDLAFKQAKSAGIIFSSDGNIKSLEAEPQIVLLKLINLFASTGKIEALTEVSTLINEVLKDDSLVKSNTTQK